MLLFGSMLMVNVWRSGSMIGAGATVGLPWEELARWLRNTYSVDCSKWAVRRACLGLGVYERL